MALTNEQIIYGGLQSGDPTYMNTASELARIQLDPTKIGMMSRDQIGQMVGDVFHLMQMVTDNKITGPNPKRLNPFLPIIEVVGKEYGGILRNIYIKGMTPTNYQGRNLVHGQSKDQFAFRGLEASEVFYGETYDYANWLSMTDTDMKKMFASPTGISEVIGTYFKIMEDDYWLDDYTRKTWMFNKMLTSAEYPLKDTQKIEIPNIVNLGRDNTTGEEIQPSIANQKEILKKITLLARDLDQTSQTGMYNQQGWVHGTDLSNYVLFIRNTLDVALNYGVIATTYHNEKFNLPENLDVRRVKNFGVTKYLIPVTGSDPVEAKPIFDEKFGNIIGFNKSGTVSEADPLIPIYDESLIPVDELANVDAVLVEKGAIFTREMLPYSVETARNAAADYTNYHYKQPNRMIKIDPHKDVIMFYHTV